MTASVEKTSLCRDNTRSRESSVDHEDQVFRHSDPFDQLFIRPLLLSLVLLIIAFPAASHAVVTTAITSDGTLSTPTTVTQNGNVFNITNGTRPGNGPNLFHSFGLFSVGMGDIANFSNNTGLLTSNILSRVTGGNPSSIFGTIQTTGFGSANLFLLNPAGVLFGPTATLNLGGSFHVSTADYLRLTDGVRFNAIPGPQDALLSTAPVAAFGFLGSNPGSITIQGSQLSVPSSQGISSVGGNITIQAGTLEDGTVQPARLSAPSGQINLASAASPGEFLLLNLQPSPNVDGASFTSFGAITLVAGSMVNVSGTSTVSIRGGHVVLTVNDAVLTTAASPGAQDTVTLSGGSSIVTATSGADPGGNVELVAGSVQMNGANITSTTAGLGRGGDVQITAGSLSLDGTGTAITTQTSGDGAAGNITANVSTLSLSNSAIISSLNMSAGLGQGGNITIQGVQAGSAADSVTLSTGASISATTGGLGPGGNLQIAAKTIQLDGAGTALTTETDGDGNAGNITLNVGALALADSAAILSNNNTNFTFGLGLGGNVTVQGLQGMGSAADSVTLSNGAAITTQTFGFERAGDVAITTGSLKLDGSTITTRTEFGPGRGGDVQIAAGTLELKNAAGIITETLLGDAVGGDLFLNVGTLTLMGGPLGRSEIRSTNFNFGTGLGGNVTIRGTQGEGSAADSVALSGGSRVFSETDFSGDGGQVAITSKSLTMDGAATVNSSTFGTGLGGDIKVNVQQLSLSGGVTITSHTDSADVNAAAGGTVTVQGLAGTGSKADSVTLSGQNTGIISETFGIARLGDIAVHAKTLSLTSGAVISAGTPIDTGTAGNVTVEADSVDISGGSQISSQAFATDAGQVKITANALTLNNGSIITNTSSAGRGGDVVLNLGNLSLMGGAQINSSTFDIGRAGDITMKVGTLTLTSSAEISSNSRGTASGNAGTVTVQGRGGLGTAATAMTLTNSSLLTNAEGTGAGGDIVVAAGSFTLNNASTVSAATAGPQNAGAITITATGNTVSLAGGSSITSSTTAAGDAGTVIISTPALNLSDSTITTSTSSSGNAGSITAKVGTLNLMGTSAISSSSTGTATGNAGSITIQGLASPADAVTLTNSTIATSAANTGQGGSISVDAKAITLTNPTISASVTNGVDLPGDPRPNITLTAPTLTMAGGSVTAETSGTRNAGSITLKANSVTLQGSATLSSASTGLGNAGDIRINPDVPGNTFGMQNSSLSTSASLADGGNITVKVNGMFSAIDSRITSSVGNPEKTTTIGGNIMIDPDFVILQNSQIRANAFAGTGGNITIVASQAFLPDALSVVDASSAKGVSGTITINSPLSNLSQTLVPLSASALHAAVLLRAQCAAKLQGGQTSSFVQVGRDNLPPEPGGWLSSPLLAQGEAGAGLARAADAEPDGIFAVSAPAGETLQLRRVRHMGPLAGLFLWGDRAGCGL